MDINQLALCQLCDSDMCLLELSIRHRARRPGNTRLVCSIILQFAGTGTSMTNEGIRSRGWCFTINNPTTDDDNNIQNLVAECKYVIIGREKGDNGTPHYQGYCSFNNTTRFGKIKRLLPRAHIEKQRGNNIQAIDYCKKENDFSEWGQAPENNDQKQKWKRIAELARSGSLSQIEEENPRIYIQFEAKLRSLVKRPKIMMSGDKLHEWWYGATGTGKSTKSFQDYPDAYLKLPNKWWDGYEDEETVVIEEWDPDHNKLASHMKRWCDRFSFNAEIKGGVIKNIRPKKIIVLSNYTIKECFQRPQDYEPLLRRFNVVHFPTIFRQPQLCQQAGADSREQTESPTDVSTIPAVHPDWNIAWDDDLVHSILSLPNSQEIELP